MNSSSLNEGFTLIELLVSIAIIGVLATSLITSLLNAQKRGYDTGALSCAKSLQTVQAMAQIDRKSFLAIGAASNQLNRSSDGIDHACRQSNIFMTDRSPSNSLTSSFLIDVWDVRGSKVYTVMPQSINHDVAGATPFSKTGLGGNNLP